MNQMNVIKLLWTIFLRICAKSNLQLKQTLELGELIQKT